MDFRLEPESAQYGFPSRRMSEVKGIVSMAGSVDVSGCIGLYRVTYRVTGAVTSRVSCETARQHWNASMNDLYDRLTNCIRHIFPLKAVLKARRRPMNQGSRDNHLKLALDEFLWYTAHT
jgi:hypothetical protein